jgi:hypothetical protein
MRKDEKTDMRIGIIDADLLDNGTRHPNLALMKISGYYKEQGHSVILLRSYDGLEAYDKVFISKVFSYTKVPDGIISLPNVTIGGTGFFEDGGENLPDEIEHHMPDYDLYKEYAYGEIAKGRNRSTVSDYLDYSIGFTTRGCFRKCSFCVNKKYDNAFLHSPVKEFYDPEKPYIYLWDDNFLAYSGWEAILDDLEATGKPFQFRQGLDIRLMTDRKAKRLSATRYHGDFIFAFDHIEERELIEEKLKLWRRYCSKTTKLYVLCAYESQDEKDIENIFERIKILMKYGCLPYIMRYESYKNSPWKSLYVQIARWCNQPQFFKKKSFRQFCEANQYYHKNKETTCSAYQSMVDFESAFPDIAEKYFDLRFEEENQYGIEYSYGYGRKYPNKQSCTTCKKQQKSWEDAYLGVIPFDEVVERYFSKELDFQCLLYPEISCIKYDKETLIDWFCDKLLGLTSSEVFDIIRNNPKTEEVLPSNIPQFSNLIDSYIGTPNILGLSGQAMSFSEIGTYLDNGWKKNEVAQRKYGENHSKLAALLDLVKITELGTTSIVTLSLFGTAYNKRNDSEKKKLATLLLFRVPIIQKILKDALLSEVDIEDELSCLAEKTKIRRKPNIVTLLQFLSEDLGDEESDLKKALNNVKGWQ